MKVVERIQTAVLVTDRFGTAWTPNSDTPTTGARKDTETGRKRITAPANRTAGPARCLASKSSTAGPRSNQKQVTMIYGTNKPPDRAAFGTPTAKQLEQDQKVTDIQKAYFAHTGQSKKKIVRPFYQLIDIDGASRRRALPRKPQRIHHRHQRANGY